MRRILLLGALAALIATHATGQQLYVITGSQSSNQVNETFASTLVEVRTDHTVRPVSTLVPKEVGTTWIGLNYDWRKAVIYSNDPDNRILVIDFDGAKLVKACDQPQTP